MAMFNRPPLQTAVGVFAVGLLTFYFMILYKYPEELTKEVPTRQKLRLPPLSYPPSPGSCNCPDGSVVFKDHFSKELYEELVQRRSKELLQHKARFGTTCRTKKQLQGWFDPIDATDRLVILAQLNLVSLNVSKGILTTTESPAEEVTVQGEGETRLVMESSSLVSLNDLLAKVSYTSTVYHIHTGDLASFQFENHEAVFPVSIKQPHLPVLYDMGTDISSHVTITTKTFLRYANLKVLLSSIRRFYSNIKVIIADDSFEPEHITGEHIQHYIMPPAQGWFAGRNLAVSQVTTKYFLWVDDDFVFTEKTQIEKLVEVMEAVPELDVVGGTVQGNQFYFTLLYEKGEEMDGGCLYRKSNDKFHSLPGYPQCFLASGVVNFFLARTDAVRKVGFDPKLQRVAHSEFFMDGLGSLLVATCDHVSIDHQPKTADNQDAARYAQFRHPAKSDEESKLQLHFVKNNLRFSYTILSVKQERVMEELRDEAKIHVMRGPWTGANS